MTATDIDLVERHVELGGKLLLDVGARLVLLQEMVLEHVVLVLGEAGLHIAARRLLADLRCGARLGAAVGLRLVVGRVHSEAPRTATVVSGGDRRRAAGQTGEAWDRCAALMVCGFARAQ